MVVSTNQIETECNHIEEIEQIIRRSADLHLPLDDIWISGEEKYPCLSILVNGEYACVHYFANENGEVWQSFGNLQREIIFKAGGEEWEAPADTILSLEMAIECMKEFCSKRFRRPECIEWQEL